MLGTTNGKFSYPHDKRLRKYSDKYGFPAVKSYNPRYRPYPTRRFHAHPQRAGAPGNDAVIRDAIHATDLIKGVCYRLCA